MKYKVKSGDTLGKIAQRNGLTLAQLLNANPQFKTHPNRLNVGDLLLIPDELTTADTQPFPLASSSGVRTSGVAAVAVDLGSLSAKYETGGRGPGTVSSGSGDPGGVSYGSYQMATKTGTAARFVAQPDFQWLKEFKGLNPGTAAFSTKWKEIAIREPLIFQQAQHEFIKRTHYDPLVAKIMIEDNLDINTRGRALQNVVWSTAVQHGGATPIVHKALAKLTINSTQPGFDEALIKAIYAERGRKRADGKLAWFSKSSSGVQASVAKRFKNELIDALELLAHES